MTFLPTPFAARQFGNHGHVLVNGKRVNIPSDTLRRHGRAQEKGQAVRDRARSRQSAERDVPDYLSVDTDSSKLADVPHPVSLEPNLVVEFYSL
jgi:small subunit ribosomal protein S4